MSVLAYQRSDISPISRANSLVQPSRTKTASVKQLLDKLVVKQGIEGNISLQPHLTKGVSMDTGKEMSEQCSRDTTMIREPTHMIIKSPKKGILVKRKINSSMTWNSGATTPKENFKNLECESYFGEIASLVASKAYTTPKADISGEDASPLGQDSPQIGDAEPNREKKIKKVTFESGTCFEASTGSRSRHLLLKGLRASFARERNERSLSLEQKVSKLTIFKKDLDSLRSSSGALSMLQTPTSPKYFTPQAKVVPNQNDINIYFNTSISSTPSTKKEDDGKKKLEYNIYQPKNRPSESRERSIGSASMGTRSGIISKKDNPYEIFKGHSSDRNGMGQGKKQLTSPGDSYRSQSGTNSPKVVFRMDKRSPEKKSPEKQSPVKKGTGSIFTGNPRVYNFDQ